MELELGSPFDAHHLGLDGVEVVADAVGVGQDFAVKASGKLLCGYLNALVRDRLEVPADDSVLWETRQCANAIQLRGCQHREAQGFQISFLSQQRFERHV